MSALAWSLGIVTLELIAVLWIVRPQWMIKSHVLERLLERTTEEGSGTFEDLGYPQATQEPVAPPTISWVSFYLATDQPWSGYELVQSLTGIGLTLNAESLFEYRSGDEVWFRVAQATQPVTFDLARLGDLAPTGLAFFMDATEVSMPRVVFQEMVRVIKELAQELNGLLVDQAHNPITPDDLVRLELQLPEREGDIVASED